MFKLPKIGMAKVEERAVERAKAAFPGCAVKSKIHLVPRKIEIQVVLPTQLETMPENLEEDGWTLHLSDENEEALGI